MSKIETINQQLFGVSDVFRGVLYPDDRPLPDGPNAARILLSPDDRYKVDIQLKLTRVTKTSYGSDSENQVDSVHISRNVPVTDNGDSENPLAFINDEMHSAGSATFGKYRFGRAKTPKQILKDRFDALQAAQVNYNTLATEIGEMPMRVETYERINEERYIAQQNAAAPADAAARTNAARPSVEASTLPTSLNNPNSGKRDF